MFLHVQKTRNRHWFMPLELRWKLSGPLRPFWYGRYEVNGKRYCPNLGVKIAGTPPASMSLMDEGDAAFERSRATAQAKLDSIVEEARSKRNAAGLVERLYEIRTGETIPSVKLAGLEEEWGRISRKRKPNVRYASQCRSTLKRFVGFVHAQNPNAQEISQVTRTVARDFMDAEERRGIAGKTWNDVLKLLRSTFRHLLPQGNINPFDGLVGKETETIYRKPFNPEELKKILDAAKDDEFIRPIVVTGVCTAMRRGDCCLLKWRDVDLDKGFVTVKTNKTGVTVDIPIIPLLFDELSARKGKGEALVFPDQAEMYLENPDGITWRVKKILALALGGGEASDALPGLPAEEAMQKGAGYIASLPEGPRKERMQTVFNHYMSGKKASEAAALAGVSKGSVSGYLNEVEARIRCHIVRGRHHGPSLTARLKNDNGLLSAEREGGARSASIRDFQSFRVTWVTLALTAGVPLELVQKVTGHRTAEIVLKHYFQPGREDFRRALQSAIVSGEIEWMQTGRFRMGSSSVEFSSTDSLKILLPSSPL
jgi:integrase